MRMGAMRKVASIMSNRSRGSIPCAADGDQREFDLETRVITNGNLIIPEMFHSCALNK